MSDKKFYYFIGDELTPHGGGNLERSILFPLLYPLPGGGKQIIIQ
jgi:hypothetical protein